VTVAVHGPITELGTTACCALAPKSIDPPALIVCDPHAVTCRVDRSRNAYSIFAEEFTAVHFIGVHTLTGPEVFG